MNKKELHERYKNKPTEELLLVMENSADYTEITREVVLGLIEIRGGFEKLNKKYQADKLKEQEIIDTSRKVKYWLEHEEDIEFKLKALQLNYLSVDEVGDIVQTQNQIIEGEREDKKSTRESVFRGIKGGLISSFIGGLLWAIMTIASDKIYFIVPIVMVIISYRLVSGYSGKSDRNMATIVIIVFSMLLAIIIGEIAYILSIISGFFEYLN